MNITCVRVRRKSTDEPLELVNQDMVIDSFIKAKNWVCVGTITLTDVPRWEMMDHAEQQVIARLKELKPDYVVYRDHDRIGFEDAGEIGWFVTTLKRMGVKVMLAKDGMELDMKDPAVMMKTVSNQLVSAGEIESKGFRTQIGRRKTVQKKSSPGKVCAYGYDWAVFDRNNQLRYIVTYEGWKKCEGRHRTRKGQMKDNWALMRTKKYPDGRREEYHDHWVKDDEYGLVLVKNKPLMEKGDRKVEVVNPDRGATVKEIFRLADRPCWLTPWEIACELNSRGIFSYSDKWNSKTVKCILTNPIYKGHPVDNRTSKARVCSESLKRLVLGDVL